MRKAFLLFMLVTLSLLSACQKATTTTEPDLGPAKLEDFMYLHDRDFQSLSSIRSQFSFDEVTPEMFINSFKENGISGHPRLVTTSEDIERVRDLIGDDEIIDKFYVSVKNRADAVLRKPRPVWGLDSVGARVQSVHEYSQGLVDAAFYYLLNPNQSDPSVQAYKTKAIDYVIALTEYKDWGSGEGAGGSTGRHFLDTGVGAANVGIFYDLMYNELTPTQRETIKQGLIRLAINPGYGGVVTGNAWWTTHSNNWNAITNGGLIIASMALYGDEGTTAEENRRYAELASKAFMNLDYHIKTYFPSGGSEEGYMYWEYALMYLELPMQAFKQNLGTTFGRTDSEFFKNIAYSPMVESGPATGLAVGDDPVKTSRSSSRIWFSNFYNLADIQAYRLETVREDKITWREVMYYKPELNTGEKVVINAPLDNYIRGLEEVSLRSSYNTNALFAGLHVGPNNASHGHLDAGQFDLQANGLNWIYGSLGGDSYQIPGYFTNGGQPGYFDAIGSEQTNAMRNHIYRIRTESKSAIVIKPGGSKRDIRQEQADDGVPVVESILSKPKGAFTIIDLTHVYRRDVESYKRGMMISQDRQVVTLQDEIVNKSEDSWVYWSVNLNAGTNIMVNPDGRSALLELAGQYMYVEIASPDGTFMIYNASYYPNQSNFPLSTGQAPNSQKKLVIRLTDIKETTISVNFVPLKQWETKPSFALPKLKPMKDWNIADGEIIKESNNGPKVDSITIDGQTLSNFSQDKTTYEYIVPLEQNVAPVVSATASSGIKVTTRVTDNYAFIFAEKDGLQTVYSIRLKIATSPSTADLLPIIGVSATDAQDGNPAENAVDGINDDNSRWSAEGVQSITLDLGDVYDVQFVSMALFNGEIRIQLYNIYLSEDGEEYQQMFPDIMKTSGTTSDFETVKFDITKARYVKIVGYGNTVSGWNSIKEIKVYGYNND